MAEPKTSDGEKGKVLVHLLVIMVGVTSWSVMNGLWVELPILVAHLPEGWTLPSLLTITSQVGNIGPLIFLLLSWIFPKTKLETPVSIVVVSALSICALLYAFLWKETADIGGSIVSVAILTLTLCQATFAATSSMSYLAFMSHLKVRYMPSIFIGQGLSGLLPAFIAIGQGAGTVKCVTNMSLQEEGNNTSNSTTDIKEPFNMTLPLTVTAVNIEPRFSVMSFFVLLFVLGLCSLVAIILLIWHPYCKTEHERPDEEKEDGQEDNLELLEKSGQQKHANANDKTYPSTLKSLHENELLSEPGTQTQEMQLTMKNGRHTNGNALLPSEDNEIEFRGQKEKPSEGDRASSEELVGVAKWETVYLLGLLVWINILQTSYVLAIQVYSSLPYGLAIYHGVTKAENIVDPLACFATFFVTAERKRVISGLTLLGTLFCAYIIVVAAMSPQPILVNEATGGILVIAAWIMCTIFMVFSKVSIAAFMRKKGRKYLIWSGASTQLGALIGAILAYVMINQFVLFKDSSWC